MNVFFGPLSRITLSLSILFSAALLATAQNLQLPSDYSIDLQLGISGRSVLMGGSPEIIGTPFNDVGNQVFRQLVDAGFNAPYPWKLTLVGNGSINASSTAGGQVYVYGGILPLLNQRPGLWAAVLSHEVAHTGLRHQVRTYLQMVYNQQMVNYYRIRIANGDKSAGWGLIGFRIAAPIALKKLERNQEHDADGAGMLLMARAGYHPYYVFALHHLLRMDTGEQSKFGAFFSSHPRWATRDQRSDKVFAGAVAEFASRWPDPNLSPGGAPPVVAFAGEPHANENKHDRTADISLPLYCHNATGPVWIHASFLKDNKPVKAQDSQFADKDGNLVFDQRADCLEKDDAAPILLHIPATAVSEHDRKVTARLWVSNTDGLVIENSTSFDVHFPKQH